MVAFKGEPFCHALFSFASATSAPEGKAPLAAPMRTASPTRVP